MKNFFDFADVEFNEAYVEESLVAEVQYDIARMMKAKSVSRAELARRLKVSAPYVTQMLGNEDANLTLRTIARIYDALGEKAIISSQATQSTSKPVRPSLSQSASASQGWGYVAPNDPWSRDDDLGRISQQEAHNDSGCIVVWLDAVRKAA